MASKIDLLLGRDIGHWALEQTPTEAIRQVFTFDSQIAEAAKAKGVETIEEDINTRSFTPSGVGFSVHYPKLLKPEVITRYKKVYNLHPAYLPWGRGFYPIFWALWEGTPAGATLHEIDAGIDSGAIVDQVEVAHFEHDTGGELYERVRMAEKELFLRHLPKMIEGEELPSRSQQKGGTYHSHKEFKNLKENLNPQMTVSDLLRLIRCLTFPGYPGLKVQMGERSFEVHLEPLSSTDQRLD